MSTFETKTGIVNPKSADLAESLLPEDHLGEKASVMVNQLDAMLNLQDDVNTKIDSEWVIRGRPWSRAIWIECGEMMDHIGYKWWKSCPIDIDQVRLEIVDVWHFALSIYCEMGVDEYDLAPVFEDSLLVAPEIARQDVMVLVCEDLAKSTLSSPSFPLNKFIAMMNAAGMTMNDLYSQYVGKNVLNTFRQDHGYKDGTYIKEWEGEEDNVVLSNIVSGLDVADVEFPVILRHALEQTYSEVIAGAPSL